MRKAIVFGASGHAGSHLLNYLLDNPEYEEITAVVRRDLPVRHTKLKTLKAEYHTLPSLKDKFQADEVFIIIGAADPAIEYAYPVMAARIAREQGAASVFVVTAVGADPEARLRYVKIKGDIERDIMALNYKHTHFFRPSMILGERTVYRPFERTMMAVWNILDTLFTGRMKKYKGIEGKNLAKAMINAASVPSEKVNIYHWKEMQQLISQETKRNNP